MFDVKDKRMFPYQVALFGALALYLYKLNKVNSLGGGTRVTIPTDKISKAIMPFVPVHPMAAPAVQDGIQKGLDMLLEGIKK